MDLIHPLFTLGAARIRNSPVHQRYFAASNPIQRKAD
jgi:hypothetical protein